MTPREITNRLHEQIAVHHPALVAAFRAIPPGGRKPGAMRALAAWKLKHRDGIEEAKTWPTPTSPAASDRLPRNKAHYQVPWFRASSTASADFRVIRPAASRPRSRESSAGLPLPLLRQENRAFVIGPMCAVNRVSAEPPSHLDCAVFSATHARSWLPRTWGGASGTCPKARTTRLGR